MNNNNITAIELITIECFNYNNFLCIYSIAFYTVSMTSKDVILSQIVYECTYVCHEMFLEQTDGRGSPNFGKHICVM